MGHRRICGPSLTETSSCGAYLFNALKPVMRSENQCTYHLLHYRAVTSWSV